MRLAITIMVIALVATAALPCYAGNNTSMKVAVHVRAHNAKAACTVGPITSCADIVSNYEGFSVDAFPVFYDLVEYKGFEYGMSWPDWAYTAAFTSCSDQVIGEIHNPGDGTSHSYFDCQLYSIGIPSFVWLYADGPGHVCVVKHPNPVSDAIYVLDCSEGLDTPMLNDSGEVWSMCAGVFGEIGGNACTGVATTPATWGQIKQLFR